jgi:hypothetical protein
LVPQVAVELVLRRAFGPDPNSPTFAFVREIAHQRPYEPLIDEIRRFATVRESTDINYDVSFAYAITDEEETLILRLSMVGPYATVFRTFQEDPKKPWQVVAPGRGKPTPVERTIRELVTSAGFCILEADELERFVPLRLDDAAIVVVYRALFDTLEGVPWQTAS